MWIFSTLGGVNPKTTLFLGLVVAGGVEKIHTFFFLKASLSNFFQNFLSIKGKMAPGHKSERNKKKLKNLFFHRRTNFNFHIWIVPTFRVPQITLEGSRDQNQHHTNLKYIVQGKIGWKEIISDLQNVPTQQTLAKARLHKLKSLKVAKRMKDLETDNFELFEGFCFLTDWLTDWRTN